MSITPALPRSKALIATAFAASLLMPALSGHAQGPADVSKLTPAQRIIADSKQTPLTKTYALLTLAKAYLNSPDAPLAERHLSGTLTFADQFLTRHRHGRISVIESWCAGLSEEQFGDNSNNFREGANQVPALTALNASLVQIAKIPEQSLRLELYYIASLLFKKAGDKKSYDICHSILEKSVAICENSANVTENQSVAAAYVLNSMALCQVPYQVAEILYPNNLRMRQHGPFSQASFKKAEALRLRAVALLDRLDSESDARRRAHRDMAIWYKELGKDLLAEKQKQTLFRLVGFNDEKLLYPQSGACGNLVWWQRPRENNVAAMDCGMG